MRLLSMAEAAEGAGFVGISLMDHLTQIPQVGREWEDFPEAYSSLAFLAGRTSNLRLGSPGDQRPVFAIRLCSPRCWRRSMCSREAAPSAGWERVGSRPNKSPTAMSSNLQVAGSTDWKTLSRSCL